MRLRFHGSQFESWNTQIFVVTFPGYLLFYIRYFIKPGKMIEAAESNVQIILSIKEGKIFLRKFLIVYF